MADENSTLVWWTQAGTQPGDDFVISFWDDETVEENTTVSTVESSERQEEQEQSEEMLELNTASADLNVAQDSICDAEMKQTNSEVEDNPFCSEESVSKGISGELESITESQSEPAVELVEKQGESVEKKIHDNLESVVENQEELEAVVEKKFVPLDDNIGQDFDVDFDEEPNAGQISAEEKVEKIQEGIAKEEIEGETGFSDSSEDVKPDSETFIESGENAGSSLLSIQENESKADISEILEDVESKTADVESFNLEEKNSSESALEQPVGNEIIQDWEIEESDGKAISEEWFMNEDFIENENLGELNSLENADQSIENLDKKQEPILLGNKTEDVENMPEATEDWPEDNPEAEVQLSTSNETIDFEFNPQEEVQETLEGNKTATSVENLDFSFDAPAENKSGQATDSLAQNPVSEDVLSANEGWIVEESASLYSVEVSSPSSQNSNPIIENQTENIVQDLSDEAMPAYSAEVESESSEVQSTLSLDQIMDAELLSSNQILTQPVSTQSQTPVQSEWWKIKNKKVLMALMSAGLVLVLWFVTVTAFPDLFTVREVENPDWTGSVIEIPQPTNPGDDPTMTPDWHWSAEGNTGFWTVDPNVVFPDVYTSGCIEWLEDCIVNTDEPEDPENIFPTPYVPEENIPEPEGKEPEIEEITITEVMELISSFKSQAEVYYNYGQKELDKYIIKYSSQITHLCENYESQIMNGEWLDLETLENFESRINLLISKINDYNGGSDTENYTVQEEPENSDFEWKEAIKDYLYSR